MEFLKRILDGYGIEIDSDSCFYKDLTSFIDKARVLNPSWHNELLDDYKTKTKVFNHLDIEVLQGDLIWRGGYSWREYVVRRYGKEEFEAGAPWGGFLLQCFYLDQQYEALSTWEGERGVEKPNEYIQHVPLGWFTCFDYTYQELIESPDVRKTFRDTSNDVYGHSERFFIIEGNIYDELLKAVNNENWIKKHNLPF